MKDQKTIILESKNEINTSIDYLLTRHEKWISRLGNPRKLKIHMKFIPKQAKESMSMDDFEIRRVIGVGGFSSVYEGKSF